MGFELDEYAYLNSPIHRWEARAKLIGLLALIFAFAFVQNLRLVPAMLAVALLVYGLSRLPLSFLAARLCYPGLFILGVVAFLPFLSGPTVLWQWGWLSIRQEGIMALLLVVGRFLSIVTLGLVLFGTTPFLAVVKAMRSLGLPALLADMLLLTYRYLFVLLEMLTTMQRSMRLRGFRYHKPQQKGWRASGQRLQRVASLLGTLFIRSYEQAEQIYVAMRLRGYGCAPRQPLSPSGRVPTLPLHWSHAGLSVSLLTAVSFVVMEHWVQPFTG